MSAAALVEARAPLLLLAPHPDDESLGCGLLLAERWARGLPTHVACLTDGGASHPASRLWPRDRLAALRRDELARAVRRLGGDPDRDLSWLGFPDAASHRVHGPGQDLGRAVGTVAGRIGAGILLAPAPEDPHCDHEAGARAAARVAAGRPDLRLWHYPVWSRWTAWEAGAELQGPHLDLPARRGAKRAAIAAHRSQMGLVVTDDADGFRMPPGFAARFAAAPELYRPVRP